MKIVKDLKDLSNRYGPASVLLCVMMIGLFLTVSVIIPTVLMIVGAMVFCGTISSPIEFPMDYDWAVYWMWAIMLWLVYDSVMLRYRISRIERRTQGHDEEPSDENRP